MSLCGRLLAYVKLLDSLGPSWLCTQRCLGGTCCFSRVPLWRRMAHGPERQRRAIRCPSFLPNLWSFPSPSRSYNNNFSIHCFSFLEASLPFNSSILSFEHLYIQFLQFPTNSKYAVLIHPPRPRGRMHRYGCTFEHQHGSLLSCVGSR